MFLSAKRTNLPLTGLGAGIGLLALLAALPSCAQPPAPLLTATRLAKTTKAAPAAPKSEADSSPTWPFAYSDDSFTPDALLDLRSLNEPVAGQSGFVRLTPDGSHFALGSGTPARFWCVNTTVYRQSDQDLQRHARFLAKIGVNMVRMHGSFSPKGKGKKLTDVDEAEIDRCWRLVAAMKKQGIYCTISPYWANGGHAGTAASWNIPGAGDGSDLWGLLFFDDALRNGYKAWARALYTRKNPYTGIPLAQEPGVGIIQIQNEDSLFFWTMQGLKPEHKAVLSRKYSAWLVKEYGSLDKAKAAWDGAGWEGDDFPNGKVGMTDLYQMTQPQQGGMAKRMRDQVRFFAAMQRDFYADIVHFYRQELGCKQLINPCNWVTADPEKLNDIERWTYTAGDVLAVNKYYNGGPHVGENNGWRIDPGHYFEGVSALRNPTALPTDLKNVVGHPMMVTESGWVNPLGYQSEGPFLMAAYQSLTGMDNFYWFSADTPAYDLDPYISFLNLPAGKPLWKWRLEPVVEASFPACALMYRRGYIQPGLAVHEERPLEDLWQRKPALIAEGRAYDPNRNTTPFVEGSGTGSGAVNPLAFLVGRVEVKYGGDPALNRAAPFSRYIDDRQKTVTSVTGEIKLNYGMGLCTLDTPKAQGATGFLAKAGDIRLGDLRISARSEYATVVAVAMDNQPLRTSRKVLVQITTRMRPTGWKTEEAAFKEGNQTYHGSRITATGTMPWQVSDTAMTLTLHNPALHKATLLNAGGYAVRQIAGENAGGMFTLPLPSEAMYLILE